MTYSTIGILALVVLIIINQDILVSIHKEIEPAYKTYRFFLLGVLIYYITDIFWGLLYEAGMIDILFVDTSVYFASMAVAVLLWARYVAVYLKDDSAVGNVLLYVGRFFFAVTCICVAVNFFTPVLFWFDAGGIYHAGFVRYVILTFQIILFLLTSIYTLAVMRKSEGSAQRRYYAIATFGVAMAIFIIMQIIYPLLPLYAIGCMIGTCLLHTLVVEDEKEEYRQKLEEALLHDIEQEEELGAARRLVYVDPLTGVKNKHAYNEAEAEMNARIATGDVSEFGMVVLDLNGLKETNDTKGHEAGDIYICDACKLICTTFAHSPVFRVGGDEFVVILEGQDFENRESLLALFNQQVEQNLQNDGPVVSAGFSAYNPTQDSGCWTIFDRADVKMYMRKQELKSMGAKTRD